MSGVFEQSAARVGQILPALAAIPEVDPATVARLTAMVRNPGSSELLTAGADGWDGVQRHTDASRLDLGQVGFLRLGWEGPGATSFLDHLGPLVSTYPAVTKAAVLMALALRKIHDALDHFWWNTSEGMAIAVLGAVGLAGVAGPIPGALAASAEFVALLAEVEQGNADAQEAIRRVGQAQQILDGKGGLLPGVGGNVVWAGTLDMAASAGSGSSAAWQIRPSSDPGCVQVATDQLRQTGSDLQRAGDELIAASRTIAGLTLDPRTAGDMGTEVIDGYNKTTTVLQKATDSGGWGLRGAGEGLARIADEHARNDAQCAAAARTGVR